MSGPLKEPGFCFEASFSGVQEEEEGLATKGCNLNGLSYISVIACDMRDHRCVCVCFNSSGKGPKRLGTL